VKIMAKLQRTELLERINSFPYWHYSFDLGDGVIINPEDITGARGVRDFIWPAVLELCGRKDLKGLRVLDIACNAGYWSLQALNSGAEYVLGIDARPMHIEQSELVRDALGLDPARLQYRLMNIYDLSPDIVGTFDVCLAFRILHHLRHPLLAIERIRDVCRSYVVFDVRLLLAEGKLLGMKAEDGSNSLHGVDDVAFNPTKAAVELMLESSGFRNVRLVPPPPEAQGRYAKGKRALFTARVRERQRQREEKGDRRRAR
jgi:SAM-dependent methyltransferase